MLALLHVGLDGFKLVNETLGHHKGDILLGKAAERLNNCVRKGDTIARIGGDEFAVITPTTKDPANIAIAAKRILASFSEPFEIEGQSIPLSGSIGIAVCPTDANTAYDLMRDADSAMVSAKTRGGGRYLFFTSELNEHAHRRMTLRSGLSKALARSEFSLEYQPKFDVADQETHSVEALLRWTNPELGRVPPDLFIPILEETGMLLEVGAWALRQACLQHIEWTRQGLPPLQIAVNMSARQLHDPGFFGQVTQIVKETGIDPSMLQLEITESTIMKNVVQSVEVLTRLRELGIAVAMDDFGTGYSSLGYLKTFPIDTLKIDRSFISDIDNNSQDSEIVRTIVTLGHILGLRVVAEGVETADQLRILRTCQCDEIQGYFFSRPVPPGEIPGFICGERQSRTGFFVR